MFQTSARFIVLAIASTIILSACSKSKSNEIPPQPLKTVSSTSSGSGVSFQLDNNWKADNVQTTATGFVGTISNAQTKDTLHITYGATGAQIQNLFDQVGSGHAIFEDHTGIEKVDGKYFKLVRMEFPSTALHLFVNDTKEVIVNTNTIDKTKIEDYKKILFTYKSIQ